MALVGIVASLALFEYVVILMATGRARGRFGVPAPATTGNPSFERYFRVQQNTIEQLVIFLPSLYLFATFVNENAAAALGIVFIRAARRDRRRAHRRRARSHRRDRAARHHLQLGRRGVLAADDCRLAQTPAPPLMGSDRATGAALVKELAARGHVIGDARSPGDSGGRYEHHDPSTGVLQATVPLAGATEVDAAVTAANEARATWRAVPMPERMAILYRLADLLDERDDEACAINALDNGTPVSAMRSGRVHRGVDAVLRGLGRQARRRGGAGRRATPSTYVLPEPYGVVGAIVPWNGPMMGMGQKAVARARRRQHRGREAARDRAVRRAALRRARARGRPAAGSAQRRRRRGGRR